MPELPEVEVLVRHLELRLKGKAIVDAIVNRPKSLGGTSPRKFRRALRGARFEGISRRAKYLLFTLRVPQRVEPVILVGHLGMTGRMYLLPANAPLPRHVPVVFNLGREKFVFEDTRYFGRMTLDTRALEALGPEPLSDAFSVDVFGTALKRSSQPIKVKLLNQSLVAGIGNIYASEALFRAGISPALPARRLKPRQVVRLWQAIRDVLTEAIECGSTVPFNVTGPANADRLFYFGRTGETPRNYEERLQVYDREGEPCLRCGGKVWRLVQAARSTFYCAKCQR